MALAGFQIINKVLQNKDYDIIKKNGLDSTFFNGFEDEFNFIVDHYKKFGNIPDTLSFLEKFPNFTITEVLETDEFLLDKLDEEVGYQRFVKFFPLLSKKVQEDSRDGYDFLKDNLENLKVRRMCKGINIIEQARERFNIYKERSQMTIAPTISTGFPELDDILGGWEFGDELVTIVGRINQGKSWILMKLLTEAWKQGKRVGLYSGEMNHIKLGYRFDSLFKGFSNRCLVRGTPTDSQPDSNGNTIGYERYIENLESGGGYFYIATQKEFGGRPTVAKIRNFIEENSIDIMGIDQLSLMDDGRASKGEQLRLRMAHITEDLFQLSGEYHIPILALAQANRAAVSKDEDEAPGMENIKESDDIAANSSKCIGMRQKGGKLILDIIKNREGRVGDKLDYIWDIDIGKFTYNANLSDKVSSDVKSHNLQGQQAFQVVATKKPVDVSTSTVLKHPF